MEHSGREHAWHTEPLGSIPRTMRKNMDLNRSCWLLLTKIARNWQSRQDSFDLGLLDSYMLRQTDSWCCLWSTVAFYSPAFFFLHFLDNIDECDRFWNSQIKIDLLLRFIKESVNILSGSGQTLGILKSPRWREQHHLMPQLRWVALCSNREGLKQQCPAPALSVIRVPHTVIRGYTDRRHSCNTAVFSCLTPHLPKWLLPALSISLVRKKYLVAPPL